MTVIIGDPGEDEPTASATTATTTTTTTTTQMKSPSIMETTPALPANVFLVFFSLQNDLLRSAVFGDSLSYVDIILMDGVRINDAKNCLDLFPQKSMFGAGSKCCTHGDTITITLGKEASILPGQRIEVNSDFLTTQKSEALQNCYDSCPLQPHKELVQFSIAKPSNPVKVDSELSEFLRNAVTRTITVPRDLITKNFTIYCEVCNFAAVCAKSNPLPVTRTARTAQLSVVVSGIPATPVPSVTLKLRAVPRFTHCNTIQHMPFDELDKSDLLTVFSVLEEQRFQVGMEPLIVEVDGFDRSISNDQPIVIDASASHDPNSKSGIVQHNWTCINVKLSNGFGCLISNVWTINWNVSVLRIPAFALNPALYLFVDNITADPLNAYARVYVKVLSSHVPSITLVELSQQRPNIDQYVRVIALVQSKSWPLYFSWHMRSNERKLLHQFSPAAGENLHRIHKISAYSYVDLPGTFPDATGELVEPSTNSDERVVIAFTIPPANTQMFPNWTGLAPGAIYCLCFEANNSAGQSFSEIAFRTNEPPTIGVLNLTPSSDIVALETPVTLSLGDGWTDLPEDLPFSYRFGVRHLGIGNTSIDRWEGVSTQNSLTKYFASAWPEPHVICDVRTGYQGLVQVCDRHGACSRTHTASFFVQHPINASAASNKLLSLAEHDILSGDVFGALSKLNAIRLEHCDSNIGESYANRVVTAILRVFKEYSDVNDFWEQISWALLMSDRLSESVTQQLYEVLEQARLKFGFSAVRSRRKRQLAISTSELKLISEDQASLLMYPFDTLLAANKSIVAMYLQNVIDVMSSFCRQVGTSRIMKAAGAGLTFVQAQGVTPGNANFLNSTFLFAGETRKMVSMTAEFKHAFSNYQCGTEQQRSVCMQICLGTAQITSEAFSRNAYLRSFIFSSTYNMIDFNRSASNFYQVSFLDPISGQFVTLNDGAAFRISIPLKSFRPSHYYATSSPMCNTADRAMFVSQISAASGVSAKRFVNVMCINDGNPIVSATLRAPFRPDQCENSYAVQAIKRAVDGSEGGLPVFTSSYAISVNASVVHRVMNGDGNARRMSLLIDRSFKDVIGNDSAASATRWLQSIAATTRVSIYRFKNPHIFVGIIFNFTITVPFEQELNPISAEEIALIIIEDTQYGELVLEGRQGEPLPVEVATLADVTELIPTSESNTLVLVLAIVVSTFFIGSSTVVAFLVILKIRTDRLLSMRERLVEQARYILQSD
ncbi:unnamed protein product [Toxocara canis]|uniref:REJ domain-containing protein n=1 Tax=Toxocara canis TaxID=6265 RepID=A0A183UH07_TOXCA|nr:unnamed protein product [Toxocara canis]